MNPTMPDKIETLPLDSLEPDARNSRTHSEEQIAQVAASIREFGFTNPVLIDAADRIIAGHGRVMAARLVGLARVPCIRLSHLTEAQRRAYVIADNKLALNAGWDETMLASELNELGGGMDIDLSLTGFASDEIGELIAAAAARAAPAADPDALPALSDVPVTRSGDVWQCGAHRVVCGDSTVPSVYSTLLGESKADVVWTDPPYNVNYATKAGKIENDNLSDDTFTKFLLAAFTAIIPVMNTGAAIYVAHSDQKADQFRSAFISAGFKLSGCLVWRKDCLVLGRSDYQWIHEPILYGWKPGAANQWFGGRSQTTVIEQGDASPFVRMPDGRWQVTVGEEVMIVDGDASVEWVEASVMREIRPKRSDGHPTMKPVALITRMLRNSAKSGAIVLDAFGGSGSTMIAAQTLGMVGMLIEKSPTYTDVIVRRWQEFVGSDAKLCGDGRTFIEVEKDAA